MSNYTHTSFFTNSLISFACSLVETFRLHTGFKMKADPVYMFVLRFDYVFHYQRKALGLFEANVLMYFLLLHLSCIENILNYFCNAVINLRMSSNVI